MKDSDMPAFKNGVEEYNFYHRRKSGNESWIETLEKIQGKRPIVDYLPMYIHILNRIYDLNLSTRQLALLELIERKSGMQNLLIALVQYLTSTKQSEKATELMLKEFNVV